MPSAGMAAEASPPRLGIGDLPETKRKLLGGNPLRRTPRTRAPVRTQVWVLVIGHSCLPRICEEEVRKERPMREAESLAREGSQGRRPVPTTPSSVRAPGCYGVMELRCHGEESLHGLLRHPRKHRTAASRVCGEESGKMKGYGKSPPFGLTRALCSPPGSAPLTPLPPPQ